MRDISLERERVSKICDTNYGDGLISFENYLGGHRGLNAGYW